MPATDGQRYQKQGLMGLLLCKRSTGRPRKNLPVLTEASEPLD